MSFLHFFDESNVILELNNTTKNEALREMIEHLASIKKIPKKKVEVFYNAVIERESQGATGIGKGVALPHAKHKDLKKISVVLARSTKGIDFEAADHQPVTILFLVLAPETNPEEYIKFLRWILHLAKQNDFRSFMLQAKTIKEVLELLEEFSPPEG